MITVDILDLQGIYNSDKAGERVLAFPGRRVNVTTEILQGIALWMNANKAIGGYYSLEMGNFKIDAARPYRNHHDKHMMRLDIVLGLFRPWCKISDVVIEENEFHDQGIVRLKGDTSMRVFRKKNFDYILEIKKFVKVEQEM